MLRSSRNVMKSYARFGRRNLSSKPPVEPKPSAAPPTLSPPQKSGSYAMPLFLLLSPVAFSVYLAYEAEQGSSIGKFAETQPFVNQIISPFRPILRTLLPPASKPTTEKASEQSVNIVEVVPLEQEQAQTAEEAVRASSPYAEAEVVEDSVDTGIALPEHSEAAQIEESKENAETKQEEGLNAFIQHLEKEQDNAPPAPPAPTPTSSPPSIPSLKARESESPASVSSAESSLPVTLSEVQYQQRRQKGGLLSHSEHYQDIARQIALFRQELEASLLKDLHTLSPEGLKVRLSQITSELFERYSWEQIRFSQALEQLEREVTDKYDLLLSKQREELSSLLTKTLLEKERDLRRESEQKVEQIRESFDLQLQHALKAQAEGFQSSLSKEMQTQTERLQREYEQEMQGRVAQLRQSHVAHLTKLQPSLSEVQAKFSSLSSALDEVGKDVQESYAIHQFSTAVLALYALLTSPTPGGKGLGEKIEGVRRLAQGAEGAEVVLEVVRKIPQGVVKRGGVLSLSDLQVRFEVMREEVRKSALAPQGAPPILGQAIGSTLAKISFAPKGFVQGSGAEETLSRASYYLERGQVRTALQEVEALGGYEKVLVSDWLALAREKLEVEEIVRVLGAESLVRHRERGGK